LYLLRGIETRVCPKAASGITSSVQTSASAVKFLPNLCETAFLIISSLKSVN
jgi:hypothetical protein